MSARRRRQTRHRTFGWRAELASPPHHNESVQVRKKLIRLNRAFIDLRKTVRRASAQLEAFGAAATRAARQIRDSA